MNKSTAVPNVHCDTSNAEAIVPDVHPDVSNTNPVVSGIRSDLANTPTVDSDIRHNKLKSREGVGGRNQPVSAARTLPVTE